MKLIVFLEDDSTELYNLEMDPDESNNLAKRYPETVNKLWEKLAEWRKQVGAKMPTQNPDYEPE